MNDYHPVLTSFPIVLISLAVGAELFYFKFKNASISNFNFTVLSLGFFFSILAFITGLIASTNLSQITSTSYEGLIATHYSFAKLILFIFIPLILFRYLRFERKVFNSLYLLLLLIQFLLIAYTSGLGGDLVFKHGVGVVIEGGK